MALKPKPHGGLRHVALNVQHLEQCHHFYNELLGFKVVWQPDADNIYMSAKGDNLALHRSKKPFDVTTAQHLDHLGCFIATPEEVDQWHDYLKNAGVKIVAAPKNHRDGTRSFYCADPDGNVVQMIYIPDGEK